MFRAPTQTTGYKDNDPLPTLLPGNDQLPWLLSSLCVYSRSRNDTYCSCVYDIPFSFYLKFFFRILHGPNHLCGSLFTVTSTIHRTLSTIHHSTSYHPPFNVQPSTIQRPTTHCQSRGNLHLRRRLYGFCIPILSFII